jgi:hypothetical protein
VFFVFTAVLAEDIVVCMVYVQMELTNGAFVFTAILGEEVVVLVECGYFRVGGFTILIPGVKDTGSHD